MKSTILKAIAIAMCALPMTMQARVSQEMKVWNARFVNPAGYDYWQTLENERSSEHAKLYKVDPNNTYRIRTGKDLTKLFKREGYKRVKFSGECSYTTNVKGKVALNTTTNQLQFVGVEESTYCLFEALLSAARYPYVYPELLESDTLSFSFDFATLVQGRQRREKEEIMSYAPPTFKGEETPYEWIKAVLGEANCKLLHDSGSKTLAVKVSVSELGEVYAEMLYTTIPIELDMDAIAYPTEIWTPTIINGKAVELDHIITFEVEKITNFE